jgi:hypothetical protein
VGRGEREKLPVPHARNGSKDSIRHYLKENKKEKRKIKN